jgi:hypothetical protein
VTRIESARFLRLAANPVADSGRPLSFDSCGRGFTGNRRTKPKARIQATSKQNRVCFGIRVGVLGIRAHTPRSRIKPSCCSFPRFPHFPHLPSARHSVSRWRYRRSEVATAAGPRELVPPGMLRDTANRYNTYRHTGLPSGASAIPVRALRGALASVASTVSTGAVIKLRPQADRPIRVQSR